MSATMSGGGSALFTGAAAANAKVGAGMMGIGGLVVALMG